MANSILSLRQKLFLKVLARQKYLSDKYYLTGGTALAEFYLPFRYSEDLDFFSMEEVDTLAIVSFLKKVKKDLKYDHFDINSSFNRNLVQLIFSDEAIKLEFTYFPFSQINKPLKREGIKIDSLLDIAVNKLFTIYQRPRSRDYMDLYMICKKESYNFDKLLKLAKAKFDWHVDPIKLGSQFMLSRNLKDYPRLLKPLKETEWIDFFIKEAKKLENKIFK